MEASFRGAGRPRKVESDERSRAFVRQVMAGGSLVDAVRSSRLSPSRALRLLDDPVFLQVVLVTRRAVKEAA